jgi:prepilin-type N-terminal cleavage/methylation domain-containing protein
MSYRPTRCAFSLLELLVTVTLVALLAGAAVVYLGEEGDKARLVRARNDLSRFQKEVQARALRAPNYHFKTLAEALGRNEPPMDPWGNPYVLMHGQAGYTYRPELTYWSDRATDALFASGTEGENGEVLQAHRILSAGPNQQFFQEQGKAHFDAQADDLSVQLKLGKPRSRSQGAGVGAASVDLGVVTVDSLEVKLNPFDHGNEDGDRIQFLLNGDVVDADHSLKILPGTFLSLTVKPGINSLVMVALNEGDSPPNTASLTITDGLGGSNTVHWSLRQGGRAILQIKAPNS